MQRARATNLARADDLVHFLEAFVEAAIEAYLQLDARWEFGSPGKTTAYEERALIGVRSDGASPERSRPSSVTCPALALSWPEIRLK